jgi:hypothetical protein
VLPLRFAILLKVLRSRTATHFTADPEVIFHWTGKYFIKVTEIKEPGISQETL